MISSHHLIVPTN